MPAILLVFAVQFDEFAAAALDADLGDAVAITFDFDVYLAVDVGGGGKGSGFCNEGSV